MDMDMNKSIGSDSPLVCLWELSKEGVLNPLWKGTLICEFGPRIYLGTPLDC